MSRTWPRAMFALACAAIIALESYVLFFDRDHTFSIQGRQPYQLTQFGEGTTVAHGFLMRGNGLRAVRVQVSSSAPAAVRLRWQLHRQQATDDPRSIMEWGLRDLRLEADGTWATHPMTRGASPEPLSIVEGGTRELHLDGGRDWVTFPLTRDGSSHDRWYVFEAQLIDLPPEGPDRPRIALLATHDNPDRGGSLFVNGVNRQGSLVLRADRLGPTIHQRFVSDAEPNLPRWLQWPVVQWLLALALHVAVAVHAYALLIDRRPIVRADGG